MTRLTTTFAAPRPALVCFITAGDGGIARCGAVDEAR